MRAATPQIVPRNKPQPEKLRNPFGRVNPEDLQNQLWDVLKKVRSRKIKPMEANAVTSAAKEICNIARVSLQFQVLDKMNRFPEQE